MRLWIVIYLVVLIWSAINPKDLLVWFLEVVPALIVGAILAITYKRFRLTNLLYFFILIHCMILMVGGRYTYAEVPLFDYLKEVFDSSRNNYDKVGHFMQGFTPALAMREVIIRKKIINGDGWRSFLIVSSCLGFGAFYEILEWWVALAIGEDADKFLGTQGYIWDVQSDMFFALIGSIMAIWSVAKFHDKQIKEIAKKAK